jgi:hypothetical protein
MTSALVNDEGAFAGGLFTLAVEQLAEPDSPMSSDLWYTQLRASSDSLTLGFGLAG